MMDVFDDIYEDTVKEAISIMQDAGAFGVARVKETISDAFPPASEPGTPPHQRTGALKEGVSSYTFQQGDVIKTVVLSERVGRNPNVPAYLEGGTSKMAARPYMLPFALWMRSKLPQFIQLRLFKKTAFQPA